MLFKVICHSDKPQHLSLFLAVMHICVYDITSQMIANPRRTARNTIPNSCSGLESQHQQFWWLLHFLVTANWLMAIRKVAVRKEFVEETNALMHLVWGNDCVYRETISVEISMLLLSFFREFKKNWFTRTEIRNWNSP